MKLCALSMMFYMFLATNVFGICVSTSKACVVANSTTWGHHVANYFELTDLMWFMLGSVVSLCSMANTDAPVVCGNIPEAISACYLVGYMSQYLPSFEPFFKPGYSSQMFGSSPNDNFIELVYIVARIAYSYACIAVSANYGTNELQVASTLLIFGGIMGLAASFPRIRTLCLTALVFTSTIGLVISSPLLSTLWSYQVGFMLIFGLASMLIVGQA